MRLQTKVNIILGLLMMFSSSLAVALGFGEIKLNSTLNQPLNAEIELINVRELTNREIVVGLASADEFDRADVDRTYFLTEFKFNVDLSSTKRPIITITTKEPVKEPFLNFIIFAQWPSGKLLREYTLLVDLPVFSGSKSSPIRIASKKTTPTLASQPANTAPANTSTSVATKPSPRNDETNESTNNAFDSEVYGPVSSKDTLWSIAAKVRPDPSFSVQQTMLAIQRLNPKAFINNNINLLKRGQVLRIPESQQITELSTREAIREVAGQNNSWSSESESDNVDDSAQLEGSKNYAETKTEVTDVEGRVKLTTASSSNRAEMAQGDEETDAGGAIAEKALDVAQEELDAADREKTELTSRLSALDEQIETMEKLVEVSNDELLALELAAKKANEADAEVDSDTPVATEESTEGSAIEEPATEVVAITPEVIEPVAQPETQTKPEKSIVDLLMENITYVAGALGGLVLCIAAFLFFRNRDDGFDDDFDEDFEDLSTFESTEFDEGLENLGDENDPSLSNNDTEVLSQDESKESEEVVSAEAETEDVVGECDIHLAYGQYDQAEEKLLRALEKEPASASVRLKLLEVFAALGDAQDFDTHYSKLLVMNDSAVTAKADSLRESVIDISPYDASKYDTSDFVALIGSSNASASQPSSVEDASSEQLDLSDDVLDFGNDQTVTEAKESISAAVDLDEGEDATLVATAGIPETFEESLSLEDEESLSLALDEDEKTLVDFSKGGVEDNALEDVEELTLESEGGDFDLGDLELDLSEDELSLADLSDDLDDVEFELNDDSEADAEDIAGESLLSEFSENLVADSSVSKSFDEGGIDFSDDETSAESQGLEDEFDELDLSLDVLKLDDDESPDMLLSEDDELADLGDLGDLGELDLDDEQIDGALPASLDEAEVSALTDEEFAAPVSKSSEEGDFDLTFNLEDGLNLDELDQELDELESPEASVSDELGELEGLGSIAEIETASADMEEPVVDLDEVDSLDLLSQPDSDELAESPIASELNLSEPSTSLNDLQAEAANELDSVVADVSESTEFDIDSEFEIPDFDPESDDDSNLDFLSDNDETATKLDLARAYIDMGDADGAKDILDEILEEGTDGQRKDAEGLLKKLA